MFPLDKDANYKILMLGTVDFPTGMAEVEKQTLIARSLVESGCNVSFICKKSFNFENQVSYIGKFMGINFLYTSFSSKRLKNQYLNSISWIIGDLVEKIYLLFAEYDFAIVNSRNFKEINRYSKIVHFKGKKLFLTHVEDAQSIYSGNDKNKLIQIKKFEQNAWHIIDGVFPISEELLQQVAKVNPSLPQMKIPVLVDLENVKNARYAEPINGGYFMFCGSAIYLTTVNYIIECFTHSRCKSKLLLVISGENKKILLIKNKIKASIRGDSIILKSYIPKENLWGYYLNAVALLIPLNFNQQDKARFPHKIGEYCAAGKPIITSNWGEIPYYFNNNENAILLTSYDKVELAEKLFELENNETLKRTLSNNAYKTAISKFSYKLYGDKILDFYRNTLQE